MTSRKYVDGVKALTLIGGIVRVDFACAVGPTMGDPLGPLDEASLKLGDVSARIAMPLPAFLECHREFARVVEMLEQEGLIRQRDPDSPDGGGPVDGPGKATRLS